MCQAGPRWRRNRKIPWHSERLLHRVRHTNSKRSPSSNTNIHKLAVFFFLFLTISFFLFSLRFQWDLVCDRKHLKAMTQTVYMGGLLVGSVAFSALSDHVGRKIVAFLSIFFLVSIAGRKDANLASENSRH